MTKAEAATRNAFRAGITDVMLQTVILHRQQLLDISTENDTKEIEKMSGRCFELYHSLATELRKLTQTYLRRAL